MTPNQKAFFEIDSAASFWAGQASKPAACGVVAGHTVEVRYVVANRKCYDNFATPTRMVKIDGKRVSLKTAMGLFA